MAATQLNDVIARLVFRLARSDLLFIDDFAAAYKSLSPNDQKIVDDIVWLLSNTETM